MCRTECQTLEFEVHGRDSFGNECALAPESVSLQSVPEGALSGETHIKPGSSPSVVTVTTTVLCPGAHSGTWLSSLRGAVFNESCMCSSERCSLKSVLISCRTEDWC